MSRKKKTLLIVGGGLILVAVAVVLIVLLSSGRDVTTGDVQIDMEDGSPILVYSKLVAIDDEGLGHSAITVCQVGSEPQKLSDEVNRFDVGENGDVICYTVRSFQEEDTLAEGDLYLQYPSGKIILCSEDVKNFEASDEGSHVIYNKDENLGVLHVCEYSSEGELVLSDSIDMQARAVYWQSSADQQFIAIRVQYEQYADADGDPIYLYHDGETELISEIVWSSAYSQGVSCDGTVLYMTDRDENTESGVLYRKPFGEEPMVVIDNATQEFAISNDGKLVAAMLHQTEEEVLFYQFEGFEPRTVAGVSQFIISEDSQTLVYLQTSDNSQQAVLYSVTMNGEPIMLADDVALIGDISNDGKSIAYVVNYSEKNHTAELYVIRNGGNPEFIDDEPFILISKMVLAPVKMSADGSAVAYVKNRDKNRMMADLYVQMAGEKAYRVDQKVGYYSFDFFNG